jgi:hypothetical protein
MPPLLLGNALKQEIVSCCSKHEMCPCNLSHLRDIYSIAHSFVIMPWFNLASWLSSVMTN